MQMRVDWWAFVTCLFPPLLHVAPSPAAAEGAAVWGKCKWYVMSSNAGGKKSDFFLTLSVRCVLIHNGTVKKKKKSHFTTVQQCVSFNQIKSLSLVFSFFCNVLYKHCTTIFFCCFLLLSHSKPNSYKRGVVLTPYHARCSQMTLVFDLKETLCAWWNWTGTLHTFLWFSLSSVFFLNSINT